MSDNSFYNVTHIILCVTLSFTYKSSPGPLRGFKETAFFLLGNAALHTVNSWTGVLCRVL